MSAFDRIEEHRELVDGLEYEKVGDIDDITLAHLLGLSDYDAYDERDSKHPDHYEHLVDLWDAREGK